MASFSNALSGLTANSKAIDITSTNLANLNTTGYKTDQVSFEDLVHQSLGSLNSQVDVSGSASVTTFRQFAQGALQTTGGPFDAAIQGNGFFVLRNAAGQQVFSRDGAFKVDATGHLVTADGNFVQGWNAGAAGLNTSGPTGNLLLPSSPVRAALASTKFSISANLNSNAAADVTSDYTTPVNVIDSQGNAHQLSVTFEKTAQNTWTYTASLPSADLAGGSGTTTPLVTGTLTFDSSGNLTSSTAGPTAASAVPTANGQIPISITGLTDSANDISLTWNLNDSSNRPLITQFGQPSASSATSVDGYPSARLVNVSLGDQGKLQASYSDGSTVAVGQLAIATVVNPDTLQAVSGNQFAVTAGTSAPVISVPGVGTQGSITGGALESSTVDIAREFTHLLTFERSYQANSKVITTEDQLLQDVIALKQ